MIAGRNKKSSARPTDPIGVFDSGIGGLSVLRELQKLLPKERFVFLADQSYVPYGEKTPAQLVARTTRIARFLLRKRCKTIVVACNTATCYAIGPLRVKFPIPFIGVVPAVKPACEQTKSGVVGVISTPATARSRTLRDLIRRFSNSTKVIRVGCPGLEEIVEEGGIRGPVVDRMLRTRLDPLRARGADIIVLGCTHYPFLRERISAISHARTLDSGLAVARQTLKVLRSHALDRRSGMGATVYFTTEDSAHFARVASSLLRRRISAHKAVL
ncbi:MAG TPA: glutamate racemase [Rhodothermia bacterium]|nr:glutamate racemase [Rhodothermia bacterium]